MLLDIVLLLTLCLMKLLLFLIVAIKCFQQKNYKLFILKFSNSTLFRCWLFQFLLICAILPFLSCIVRYISYIFM